MSDSIFENIWLIVFILILGSVTIAIGLALSNASVTALGGLLVAFPIILGFIGIINSKFVTLQRGRKGPSFQLKYFV